jgi:hypothetical protein
MLKDDDQIIFHFRQGKAVAKALTDLISGIIFKALKNEDGGGFSEG